MGGRLQFLGIWTTLFTRASLFSLNCSTTTQNPSLSQHQTLSPLPLVLASLAFEYGGIWSHPARAGAHRFQGGGCPSLDLSFQNAPSGSLILGAFLELSRRPRPLLRHAPLPCQPDRRRGSTSRKSVVEVARDGPRFTRDRPRCRRGSRRSSRALTGWAPPRRCWWSRCCSGTTRPAGRRGAEALRCGLAGGWRLRTGTWQL